ncbi:hypothetical protein [Actinacidiphila glaucinigra]|uniref:hypothetical protein n=1 Tax=Actinacidiphila glaucinigra TaxID=235986 RepID=UPI00371D98D1
MARGDQRTGDLPDALARTQREILALVKRNRAAATPPPAPTPPAAGDISLSTDTSHPPVSENPQPTGGATPSGPVKRSGARKAPVTQAAAVLQAELADLLSREPGATIEMTWRVVDR